MTRFLGRKLSVVLFAVLGGLVALAASRSTWITGTADSLLGPVRAEVDGTQAAPGLAAIGLVALAAAVAAVTGRRIGRIIAAVILFACGAGGVFLVIRSITSADSILGGVAATDTGALGAYEAHATVSIWPWLTLISALFFALAVFGIAVGGRAWSGLGGRYDAGGGEADVSGARGERVTSDWDRLSAGEDPTEPGDGEARRRG